MMKYLKLMIGIVLCCGLVMLVGCGKVKPVSMEQLEADIPQEVKELIIERTYYDLEVDSMEVVKRSTEDIYDEVHCDLVMSSEEYQVSCRYVAEYKYYDQGGWSLMDFGLEDVTASCTAEIPSALQFCMEKSSVSYDGQYYDVENIECIRRGDNGYEFAYDVKSDGEYRYEQGKYKLRYSLDRQGTMYYTWEGSEDANGITTTWDIVGTYTGTGNDKSVNFVIDSYDPSTQVAHISSYHYEASKAWFLGGDELYDFSDMDIIAEISEPSVYNDFSKVLSLQFPVKSGEYHMIRFEQNKVSSSSMILNRSK